MEIGSGPRRVAVRVVVATLFALSLQAAPAVAFPLEGPAVRPHPARPAHLGAWLCIHRYEGAWNDPGAPYWGGLQMDLGFQRTYGADLLRRKGLASNWTPLEQIRVAERALRSGRGFYPWPNAARLCGLI